MRPFRSVLYIPASKERALEKARDLPCDAIIFDLEDAVAPEEKPAARALVAKVLTEWDYGQRARLVRINGFDTAFGAADASALALALAQGAKVEGVVIPKVSQAADLEAVARVLPGVELWAMMETPMAMLNAGAIAAHPRLRGMIMGTNDLAADLGARSRADRLPLMAGLGASLIAARAHGKQIVDGVFNAFRDEEGLRAECEQGRDMGFDGKTLIHPAQIATANAAFGPSPEELDTARRQIAAYEAALAQGQAVAVVDGKIVENLHIVSARALLAKAAQIALMG